LAILALLAIFEFVPVRRSAELFPSHLLFVLDFFGDFFCRLSQS
jgi:hypothetical protein